VSAHRRREILLIVGLITALFCARNRAWAQACGAHGTGEFLCSAGACDGRACTDFSDCPGGVCVIAQGVCNDSDGLPCDCPASTCSASPVCSSDATMGTCSGGTSQAECCDVTRNCNAGVQCVGAQKLCINGDFKGFSCLNNQQCTNGSVSGTCASTGKSCGDNSDFAGFSCVDDSDCCPPPGPCPAGSCTGAGPTPTRTPTSRTPRPTNTPTSPMTPQPTATPGTPAPTVATNTPQPTETPLPTTPTPNVSVLAESASAGARVIVVQNASNLAPVGTLHIGGDPTTYEYVRASINNNRLKLTGPSLANDMPAGTVVVATPKKEPVPVQIDTRSTAQGCAIDSSHPPSVALSLGLAALVLRLAARRKRIAR